MSKATSRLTVKPLHPLFVAEICGADLTGTLTRDTLQFIWNAFNEHQVLVLRDQALDDESQIRFSRYFGTLEMMEPHAANEYNPGYVAVMSNVDADGNLLPLTHPAMIHRERNEIWHTDSSFKPVGALCSLLHARILPPVGGNTEFASARAAYATLSRHRKEELESLQAIHRLSQAREVPDTTAYSEDQVKRPTVVHPLVRTNPVNGHRNLYVGAHAKEVVGMPVEAGRALLEELTALCTQPQFVYSHSWREHDLVIYDNRCALHRATPFENTRYGRKMHRTIVAGTMPESVLARMPESLETA